MTKLFENNSINKKTNAKFAHDTNNLSRNLKLIKIEIVRKNI